MTGAIKIRIICAILFLIGGCTYNEIPKTFFNCNSTTLAVMLVSKLNPTSCLAIDGAITVAASGGIPPYAFTINNETYRSNGAFLYLGQGSYTLYAKDANNCERWIQVGIAAPGSTLDAAVATTPDNQCLNDNGSIMLTATGGTPPYSYQFGTEKAGKQNSFSNLKSGSYPFLVRDTTGCLITVNVHVKPGDTGTTFATEIKPILHKNCAIPACYNGANGTPANWIMFRLGPY